MPWHTFDSLTGISPLDGFVTGLIGLLVSGGVVLFFLFVGYYIFKKEAMGFGDVVLMAMVGSFVGWKLGFVAFFIAPFIGILYGMTMIIIKGDHYMAYGPWLAAATLFALLFRGTISGYINAYIETVVALCLLLGRSFSAVHWLIVGTGLLGVIALIVRRARRN